jgi:glycine cleavage system aminomethyltransferase T
MSSLQDKLDGIPDLVDYFYNDTLAPHAKHRADLVPIPPEFTNWRDEQRSWRETAVLFDQSHHMPELLLSGPDCVRLLRTVGINSFENIAPGRVKQLIGCAYDGHVIGESVAYCHDEDSFELVSERPATIGAAAEITIGGWHARPRPSSVQRPDRRVDEPQRRARSRSSAVS